MKFSPVVSSNTQSMFSWVGSVPGIFTGEHVFRFEEIPASEQGQSRTRFVHEETFTGLLSFLMGRASSPGMLVWRRIQGRDLLGSTMISKLG